jgi:predicted dienelactone hydrolase
MRIFLPRTSASVSLSGFLWGASLVLLGFQGTACTEAESSGSPGWLEPGEAGPWIVGTEAFEITGSDGLSLDVQVWFPSLQEDGAIHRYGGLFKGGEAIQSPVPDCAQVHPLLAFSHGYAAINFQSYFLTEHLASQGWVIVAPDHRGNTLWDNTEDKTTLALRRPIDIRDSVDWLFDELSARGGDLEGCIDPEAGYAISGHSFGGFTTLATAGATVDLDAAMEYCKTTDEWLCSDLQAWAEAGGQMGSHDLGDDRIWAAIPMAHAGYEFLYTGLDQIDMPTMLMGGGRDEGVTIEGQLQPTFDDLLSSEPRYMVEIEEAGHYVFSNACQLLSGMAGDECTEDYIDPEQGHEMIRSWTSAFLQQVQGREDACEYLPGDFDGIDWQAAGLGD